MKIRDIMSFLHNERGICLPDVSLFQDICKILGLTLNEFFVGEKIKEEDCKEKTDENLLNTLNHKITLY